MAMRLLNVQCKCLSLGYYNNDGLKRVQAKWVVSLTKTPVIFTLID